MVDAGTLWLLGALLILLMLGPALIAELRDRAQREEQISEEALKDIDRRKNNDR